jgi:undecaprenyl-phosphate galactose phosphotransferase
MQKKYLANFLISISDLFVLILTFYITLFIRINISTDILPSLNKISLYDFSFVIMITFVMLYYEKIYKFRYDFWQDTLSVFRALFLSYIMVLAILSLAKISFEYSRTFITLYFLVTLFLLPIAKRYIKKAFFKGNKHFRINTLVVGNSKEVDTFKEELRKNWYLGQKPTQKNYDGVVIISKGLSTEKLNEYISYYIQKTRDVFVVPYISEINFAHSNILELNNIRNNAIQVENKLLIKSNTFIKDFFDYFLSIIILPIFIFIHLIISFFIKLDSKGKIFFKQKRLGKDSKVFEVYKYRTMYENGDDILKKYLQNNPDEIKYYQKYHKYKNDPRITKIGKILRATSLDELPQIINVLKNEMSLVGPRPYMIEEENFLQESKNFILKVKPGITGLWQVSGRNNLTFQERNDLEVWYIKNWSLWADIVILIKTIKVVLLKVGAK